MSNHDKKPTPKKRAPRSGSPGAEALARASAQDNEQRRTEVIPSPVPYDSDELGSGRGITYEWEYWVDQLQQQIDNIGSSGGGGGGTGSATVFYSQSTPAAVWTINHSLNTRPDVLLVDSAGQQMIAEIHYPSTTQVTVTHGAPYSGVAYLRA